MTKLFLYGLGFCCLSIVGLLILDAHMAKRRLRQWADKNWNPFFGEEILAANPADNTAAPGGNSVLPKRRKVFKPVLLTITAATIVLVSVIKRHATATQQHPLPATREGLQAQHGNAGDMASGTGDFPAFEVDAPSWSFMSAFSTEPAQTDDLQVDTIWDTSEWLGVCEWLPGDEDSSASETDVCPAANIDLSTWFSVSENESDAMDLSSQGGGIGYEFHCNTVRMENGRMLLNCSLAGGASAPGSGPLDTGMMIP